MIGGSNPPARAVESRWFVESFDCCLCSWPIGLGAGFPPRISEFDSRRTLEFVAGAHRVGVTVAGSPRYGEGRKKRWPIGPVRSGRCPVTVKITGSNPVWVAEIR